MRGLDGRVVVLTGGGGGIGAETALRFADEGARVAVLDLSPGAAAEVAERITRRGGVGRAYPCDITDGTQVERTVATVVEDLGPVDVLVNNAGWDVFRPFLQTGPDDWRRLVDVNLMGPLIMHRAVLPAMVERGRGRVVTIASDAARVGSSGEAVYAACKAGMLGLSKTLAREHARDGITFNVVCPGPTETALLDGVTAAASDPDKLREAFRRAIPMGRLGQPTDLPGAICFFASDDAEFITGQVLSVSGGLTMVG
ncbi:MAG TPA: SDR family NAD(P)-dependent oxidoreductase [Acidimicrobiia bacterium]|nr:SDR family NAD(P)-dependent oxidoreductase [Acidimicrobiia bacterium]